MPYNFVADSIHISHKETLLQISSSEVHFSRKTAILCKLFILGSLESAYSGLTVSDNYWTFSLGVTAEAIRANIDWKFCLFCFYHYVVNKDYQNRRYYGNGSVWPKLSHTRSRPCQSSSCRKTRWMRLLYGIRISASFFRFIIIHAFDRRRDGRKLLG